MYEILVLYIVVDVGGHSVVLVNCHLTCNINTVQCSHEIS